MYLRGGLEIRPLRVLVNPVRGGVGPVPSLGGDMSSDCPLRVPVPSLGGDMSSELSDGGGGSHPISWSGRDIKPLRFLLRLPPSWVLTKYDLGPAIAVTVPSVLPSGIQTLPPVCRGSKSEARCRSSKFLFWRSFSISSVSRSAFCFGSLGFNWSGNTGNVVRRHLPINNWAGLYPFARGVDRYERSAKYGSVFLSNNNLIVLTALSAAPFAWG